MYIYIKMMTRLLNFRFFSFYIYIYICLSVYYCNLKFTFVIYTCHLHISKDNINFLDL